MWDQIRSNKRRSAFVLAMMGVLLVLIGAALGAVLTGDSGGMLFGAAGALVLWFVLWVTMVTNGDDIMMRMTGAREIEHKDHPVLFNIVEEMTIAAQLPKRPRVFIVDDPSPNAFATGRDPDKASVAVTTGFCACSTATSCRASWRTRSGTSRTATSRWSPPRGS